MTKIYDLFYSDGNSRDHFGRLEAADIDHAVDLSIEYFFKPEHRDIIQKDYVDEKEAFLIWVEPTEEITEEMDYGVVASYYNIVESEDQETRSFKTIYGENNFFYVGTNGKLVKDLDEYTILENQKRLSQQLA